MHKANQKTTKRKKFNKRQNYSDMIIVKKSKTEWKT